MQVEGTKRVSSHTQGVSPVAPAAVPADTTPGLRRDTVAPSLSRQGRVPGLPAGFTADGAAALTSLNKLDQLVARAAGPRGGAALQDIRRQEAKLRTALSNGHPRNAMEAARAADLLTGLARRLAARGLLTPQVRGQLDTVHQAALRQMAGRLGVKLELLAGRSGVAAVLGVSTKGKVLTDEQRAFLAVARSSSYELERIKAAPARLDAQKIYLLSLRDTLLKRSYELAAPPRPYVDGGERQDVKAISDLVAAVDKALAETRKLSPDLLADLKKITDAIADAPTGKVDEALDKLQTALPEGVQKGADAVAKVAGQLRDQGDKWSPQLSNLGSQLVSLVKNAPHDLSDRVGKVIDGYSANMNLVRAMLPPVLPFTYTMPVPFVQSDGNGNSITIAAGSSISKSGGNYIINSPGMAIQSGSTAVSTTNGTLVLGSSADTLSFNQLSVVDGGTTATLNGFEGQIDRTTGASHITADEAIVDMASGQIKLTKGALTRDADGNIAVTADNFLYDQNGTQASLAGFNLSHTTTPAGVSTLAGGANTIDFKQGSTVITADAFTVQMVRGGDPAHPDTARLTGTNVVMTTSNEVVKAGQATIDIVTNADGSSSTVITGSDASWQSGDKNLDLPGNATITLDQAANGQLTRVQAQASDLTYTDPKGVLKAQDGSLTINYGPDGKVSGVSAAAGSLDFTDANGHLQATGGKLDLVYGPGGALQQATGSAQTFAYNDGKGNLSIKDGNFALNYGPDGKLTSATAGAQAGSYSGDFGSLALAAGGNLTLTYAADGTLQKAAGNVGSLTYDGDKGHLELKGGQAEALYGPDGKLQSVKLHGDAATFTGTTGSGAATQVAIDNFNGSLTVAADGSKTLNFDSGKGSLELDGKKVAFQQIKTLQVVTGPDGAISKIDLDMPGKTTYEQDGGDLKLAVTNAQGHYEKEGSKISLSFGKLEGELKSKGLSGSATGGVVTLDDKFLKVHVDTAELKKTLGEQIQATVERVDLLVEKNEAGGLKSADLQVGGATAKVKGYDVIAVTKGGDRIRLHMETSPDGTMISEAWLQIPEGGEVKITKDDLTATLGPQMLRFTQDGLGHYTLHADGLNADVTKGEAHVTVQGGSAQVMLDANTGDLVIQEISGTHIHVDYQGQTADIDLTKIKDVMIKAAEIKGEVKGYVIKLEPASDGSTITASVSARVNGFPISIKFDNLTGLNALFSYRENEMHFLAEDPGRRGDIELGVGPLKLEGTAIEVIARYTPYNAHRLMSTMSRFFSTKGTKISKRVQMENDGVLRATTNGPGLYADIGLIFPNNSRMAPGQRWNGVGSTMEVGPGVIGSLGGQIETKGGTKITGAVFAGAVSGSYLTWDQAQGSASIYGVTIPNTMDIPTTAVAGVRASVEKDKTKVEVVVGGYVNPAGFAPKDGKIPLNEASKFGGLAGVHVQHDNVHVGLDGVVAINPQTKKLDPGIRLGTEVTF